MQESIEGWSGVGIKANHLLDKVADTFILYGCEVTVDIEFALPILEELTQGAPSKNSSAMTQPTLKQSIDSVTLPSLFPSVSSAILDFFAVISGLVT